jgi:hypothetical protein
MPLIVAKEVAMSLTLSPPLAASRFPNEQANKNKHADRATRFDPLCIDLNEACEGGGKGGPTHSDERSDNSTSEQRWAWKNYR